MGTPLLTTSFRKSILVYCTCLEADFSVIYFCCQNQLLSVIAILINFNCLIDEEHSFLCSGFFEPILIGMGYLSVRI